MCNNEKMSAERKNSVREVYQAFVELIYKFDETTAFCGYEEEFGDIVHAPFVKKCKYALQKSRYDIRFVEYKKLEKLLEWITDTSYDVIMDSDEAQDIDEEMEQDAILCDNFVNDLVGKQADEFSARLHEALFLYIGED